MWTRQQYREYVVQYLKTPQNVEDFLACWNDDPVPSVNPNRRKQMSNPNERELRERDAQDKEREETMKDIKARFQKGMEKELQKKSKADKRQDDTDSDASVKI